MSDIMRPPGLPQIISHVLSELSVQDSVYGIPQSSFYAGGQDSAKAPPPAVLGPAAGPHSQLAPNILTGYLCGARFFELKTVQILDSLEIEKPCIDARNEAYNVEWSSELSLEAAFDEYLKAWFLLHAFSTLGGRESTQPDFVFNASIGYDLAGISGERVDRFIEKMKDASLSPLFESYRQVLEQFSKKPEIFQGSGIDPEHFARVAQSISPNICSQISISTMHGCPPDEIEAICSHILRNKKLDCYVKLNPTLLGKDFVRSVLDESGYESLDVPDSSFEHDINYSQATAMLHRLQKLGKDEGRVFGIKLTNTLEVINREKLLPGDQMYLSGRPLFPLAIQLASKLADEFEGSLPISFSAGIAAYNIREVLETGIAPVTVCTELLKPGGYRRLGQLARLASSARLPENGQIDTQKLRSLADFSLSDKYPYRKKSWRRGSRVHMNGRLELFDCVKAPCISACPIDQDVPGYIRHIRSGEFAAALELIYQTNPLPSITGNFCSRYCQSNCTRLDYDNSLEIRELKKLAARKGRESILSRAPRQPEASAPNALVKGNSILSLAAAGFLADQGYATSVQYKKEGENELPAGTSDGKRSTSAGFVLNDYRIPSNILNEDIELLIHRGVRFTHGQSKMASQPSSSQPAGDVLVLDCREIPKSTPVDDIASARTLVSQLISEQNSPRPSSTSTHKSGQGGGPGAVQRIIPPTGGASSDTAHPRGTLFLDQQLKPVGEHSKTESSRCLDCDLHCNKCVDTCPNRANIPITVPGMINNTQILHIDSLCNECGNCEPFCPWEGRPYRDKFTLFDGKQEMENSSNSGFYIDGDQVVVRTADGSMSFRVGERPDGLTGSGNAAMSMIDAIIEDHAYLFEEKTAGTSKGISG